MRQPEEGNKGGDTVAPQFLRPTTPMCPGPGEDKVPSWNPPADFTADNGLPQPLVIIMILSH